MLTYIVEPIFGRLQISAFYRCSLFTLDRCSLTVNPSMWFRDADDASLATHTLRRGAYGRQCFGMCELLTFITQTVETIVTCFGQGPRAATEPCPTFPMGAEPVRWLLASRSSRAPLPEPGKRPIATLNTDVKYMTYSRKKEKKRTSKQPVPNPGGVDSRNEVRRCESLEPPVAGKAQAEQLSGSTPRIRVPGSRSNLIRSSRGSSP